MTSTFVIAMIAFPWIGIAVPFFILIGYFIVSFSTRALRETTRRAFKK